MIKINNLKKPKRQIQLTTFVPIISLVLALLVGTIFIVLSGNNPVDIYSLMFRGALATKSGLLQSLLQATPLIFSGLSVAIAYRGGLLNLGVEGQMYFGALFSALVGLYVKNLPHLIHVLLCIVAGIVGGVLWSLLPVLLKLKRGVNEVVSALMLNYVALLFVEYLTTYPLHSGESYTAQTARIADSARLSRLVPNSQVNTSIFIALALVVLAQFFFKRTRLGYNVRMTGLNLSAASAAGINSAHTMVLSMVLAGAVSGLAGVGETLGTHGRLVYSFSPGYGFTGIAVAMLGTSIPSVIFSALLFGVLRAGSMALSLGSNLSVRFLTMLQGIIILFVAAPQLSLRILQNNPFKRKKQRGEPRQIEEE